MILPARNILAEKLIGTTPSRKSSVTKGAGAGLLMFVLFEFVSTVNSNAPRVPVVWLLTVFTVVIEIVLFIRISTVLRLTRNSDLFFVLRLDYRQRTEIALDAVRRAHTAFIPFIVAALVTAAVLEGTVIKERSWLLLGVLPIVSALFLLGAEAASQWLIRIHAVKPIHKDNADHHVSSGGGIFRRMVRRISLPVATNLKKYTPYPIRVMVMRNVLYLLRGELFITLLLTTLFPVAVCLVLLLLEGLTVHFLIFLPLLALFLISQHVVNELAEASAVLPVCHWYIRKTHTALAGFTVTLIVIGLPFFVVMIALMLPHLTTLQNLLALINGSVAYILLAFTAAGRILSFRNESDKGGYDLAVFVIVSIGIFVPYAGIAFTFAAFGLEMLQQWEVIKNVSIRKVYDK